MADSAVPRVRLPAKKSKLFHKYSSALDDTCLDVDAQLTRYLEMRITGDVDDALTFWQNHSSDLDKLYHPALRALSIPASSSPVERVFTVFSHGGIILRPHRAKMSDSKLSSLIFLKCNSFLM